MRAILTSVSSTLQTRAAVPWCLGATLLAAFTAACQEQPACSKDESAMLALLRSADATERGFAVQCSEVGSMPIEVALQELVDDTDADVRSKAVKRQRQRFCDPGALVAPRAVVAALRHRDTRVDVAHLLGCYAPDDTLEAFESALDLSDDGYSAAMASAVAKAVTWQGKEAWREGGQALLQRLAIDGGPATREAAYKGLGNLGPYSLSSAPLLLETLKTRMRDDAPARRPAEASAAITALGKICVGATHGPCAEEAPDSLVAVLKAEWIPFRDGLALEAINKIGPAAGEAVVQALSEADSPLQQTMLLNILNSLLLSPDVARRALPVLQPLTRSTDHYVSGAARAAMANNTRRASTTPEAR